MRRKVERLSLDFEVDFGSFGGYISASYAPIAGTERLELLSGDVSIGGDPKKPLSGEAKRLFERAMALGPLLSEFLRARQGELEVDESIVRPPLKVTRLRVRVDEARLEVSTYGLGHQETKAMALDALPDGQRRLLDSIRTSLERVAWEHFREQLGVPTKEERLQVFISYRKLHELFAESLARRLGDEGIVTWFDKWDILAGDSVPGEIEKGLQESIAFIPILTADYQQGTWATEELQSAIAKRTETDFNIIPVLLENCERPELVRHLRYVDFTAQDPETFESKVGELIDSIYSLTLNPFRQ